MATLEPGRRLADRYVLRERLGDGGHAEVWAARDERDGSLVALKFLHLNACSPEEVLPVLRHEARMARFLEHPGVLKVEEPVQDGDVMFLPMEYAQGQGAERLRGAHWRNVVPVLLEVARVLQHAHARGIVHRDIKPGNVLFDSAGRVRVADFGTSALAGSRDAPANGSPFSASPQQLRGEAASPADDVYGLGALAHELLTRYPPFYPNFDALRVQEQDPPRATPVQPAPAALIDLIEAMLSRDASARPLLPDVIQELESCLALPAGGTEEGAVVVEAAPGATPAATATRARPGGGWWWLAGTAVAAGAVLMLLPEPEPDTLPLPVAQKTEATPAVPSVADALVRPATQPVEPAAVEAGEANAQEPARPTVEDELGTAQRALAALKPAEASAAFRRTLALDADNAAAREGLVAALRLQDQLAGLAEGTRLEAAGNLQGARERYQQLLRTNASFAPARNALARVDARLGELQLEDQLIAGVEALRRGDVEQAEAAYAGAAALQPRDARVLDGQQRIAEIRRDRQNASDLTTGAQLEATEGWSEAVAHYRAALERDAGLRFAQEGLSRSERRAALDAELADYQARPERLTAPAVRQAAQRALARGEATATDSPRLAAQLAALRTNLAALNTKVRLALSSDSSTRVSVSGVGELGLFESRELDLAPGHYTVVGQREGFRDVRHELDIAPGQRELVLSVRCTDPI